MIASNYVRFHCSKHKRHILALGAFAVLGRACWDCWREENKRKRKRYATDNGCVIDALAVRKMVVQLVLHNQTHKQYEQEEV